MELYMLTNKNEKDKKFLIQIDKKRKNIYYRYKGIWMEGQQSDVTAQTTPEQFFEWWKGM